MRDLQCCCRRHALACGDCCWCGRWLRHSCSHPHLAPARCPTCSIRALAKFCPCSQVSPDRGWLAQQAHRRGEGVLVAVNGRAAQLAWHRLHHHKHHSHTCTLANSDAATGRPDA